MLSLSTFSSNAYLSYCLSTSVTFPLGLQACYFLMLLLNLNSTMNVIGTIDEIVNTVNPYSPQSEYYNSLRRGLFPNRADMEFANNCFAYYSTMTSQNFPSGPTTWYN